MSNILHVGLTGHRPKDLWGYDLNATEWQDLLELLKQSVLLLARQHDKVVCHSGMAQGADTIWAMAIVDCMDTVDNVEFIAEVPSPTQPNRWAKVDYDRYYDLLERATDIVVYEQEYTPWCMESRNRGMVDSSDFMFAVWNGNQPNKGSGTWNAVRYTLKNNKTVYQFHPDNIFNINKMTRVEEAILNKK